MFYSAVMYFCAFGAFFTLFGTMAWFRTHALGAVVFMCVPSVIVGLVAVIWVWLQALKIEDEKPKKRDDLERLKAEFQTLENGSAMTAERWQQIEEQYLRWEACLQTSPTNRRLQLLKMASEAFPELHLRDNSKVIDLILAGIRRPGESVDARLPDGRVRSVRVVRREITERLAVLYTLESQEGVRFTNEFFG